MCHPEEITFQVVGPYDIKHPWPSSFILAFYKCMFLYGDCGWVFSVLHIYTTAVSLMLLVLCRADIDLQYFPNKKWIMYIANYVKKTLFFFATACCCVGLGDMGETHITITIRTFFDIDIYDNTYSHLWTHGLYSPVC